MASDIIKKVLTFTPRMYEMVGEIEREKGYISFSAVIHQAIIDLHDSTFPKYAKKKEESPRGRIERLKAEKEAKLDIAREGFIELLDALGGKIERVAGKEFAVYFTYTGRKRYEQKVPLEMLSTDIVKTQYQPSKEKVEQLQREGKVDY